MHYQYLIFDIDDTLFDYEQTERMILAHIFADNRLQMTEEIFQACWVWSWQYWKEQGMADGQSEETRRRYHEWYHTYLDVYFGRIKEEYQLTQQVSVLHQSFLTYMQQANDTGEQILTICKELSATYRLVLASNGLAQVQCKRMEPFMDCFQELFISEELGTIKPDPVFFEKILCKLDAAPEKCLMIGDSLSSDIQGANLVGMDSCWYNPKQRENQTQAVPTFEIRSWEELEDVLSGRENQ